MVGDQAVDVNAIATLEEAKARIRALEARLDETFDVLVRRDEALTAAEHRILLLEEKLESQEGA